MNARPLINSLEFARTGQQLTGEIPFAQLSRLVNELFEPTGVLHYRVLGSQDKRGDSWLTLEIEGQCFLTCQRCLQALPYHINLNSQLMLRSEAELAEDEDDEEDFDSILASNHLDVLELLEEEVLLSLPIAPKHIEGDCQMSGGEKLQKDKPHPFAALANLKRN